MALQSRAIPVLITRPEPQASRFAEEVRKELGPRVIPILTPLFIPRFISAPPPEGNFGAVIFTSEAGVLSTASLQAPDIQLPKRAYCVGDRTAHVAEAHGFKAVSADGNANDLIDLLLRHRSDAPFLHLRGKQSRGDIVERLVEFGVPATEHVTYEQVATRPSEEAVLALDNAALVLVPLFSPEAARHWSKTILQYPIRAKLVHFALSPAVAAELATASVQTALRPTQADLLRMMSQYPIGA